MQGVRLAGNLERVSLWLLLATHAGLPWLLLRDASVSSIAIVAREALVLSQVSLAVAVLLLVRGRWLIRGSLATIPITSLFLLFRLDYSWLAESVFAQLAFVEAILAAIAMLGLRFFGYSLTALSATQHRMKWRFSLRALLGLTTAAALIFGLSQAVRSFSAAQAFLSRYEVVASVAIAMTGVTLLGVWLLLEEGSPILRTATFAVAAVALSFLPTYVCHHDADWAHIGGWGCAHAVIVAVSLLVLRSAGYRRVCRTPSVFERLVTAGSIPRKDTALLPERTSNLQTFEASRYSP
jgi:hypothetical protein